MKRRWMVPATGAAALIASVVMATPASAHGYVNTPPSRQAMCAQGRIACGAVKYEPQSVEGPKGQINCSGGKSAWAELDDNSRSWPVTSVGSSVNFSWILTAPHRTASWDYFVDGKLVTSINGGNNLPGSQVTHTVNLSAYPGRHTVLARWSVGDTTNAFYNCVDLQIGSGGSTTPPATTPPATKPPVTTAPPTTPPTTKPPVTTAPPTTKPPVTTAPPTTKPPVTTPPAPGTTTPRPPSSTRPRPPSGPVKPTRSGHHHGTPTGAQNTWRPRVRYHVGDEVIFNGVRYVALMNHTSFPGWEPPFVRCLWQRL